MWARLFETKAEAMPGEGPASMILKTSIKYWPAEYHSQSAIEAALFLRKQIEDLSQVKSMVIESHDASVDIIGSEPEKWKPQQRETADHSLPYITAVALIDGEVTDKQFEPERFTESGDHLVPRERESGAERRAERAVCESGGEHRARHVGGRPHADEASRLPAREREESG